MSIHIITDSAADFTRQERQALRLGAVPIQVLFGEETYLSGETLDRATFWARLLNGEQATTSQPAPDAFLRAFEQAIADGGEALYIAISSALSGTMQSAMIARSMLDHGDRVHIVDSRSASIGQKLLVMTACRLRDEGRHSAAQIAREIEALRGRVRLFANVDTLAYLARGGRISRAAASIGTLAQIKPMISLDADGAIEVVSKAVGRHRAIDSLVKKVTAHAIDRRYPVIPVYSHTAENADVFLRQLVKAGVPCDAHLLTDLGEALSAHVGPAAYGLAFVEAGSSI